MIGKSRLQRLAPGLTARERAILVLRSMKDKTPEDPAWRNSMPTNQASEFSRLIVLMNACNIFLPLYISVLEQRADRLHMQVSCMLAILGLGLQSWKIAALVPKAKRKEAEAVLDWPAIELPWVPELAADSWVELTESIEGSIRRQMVSLWEEVRSIEIVVDEVAQEFDGEDPLRPIMRSVVDKTKAKLQEVHLLFNKIEPLELSDPDESEMELARAYFDSGRNLMQRI